MRRLDNLAQAHCRAAVGEKIVDNQHIFARLQKPAGHNDLVFALVRKRFDRRGQHRAVQIDRLRFFGEHHRHAEILRHNRRNADTGGFDGQNFVHLDIGKPPLEFLADLVEQVNIHLVIEEIIHLQHISLFNDAVFPDSFFQKFHALALPCPFHPHKFLLKA